MCVHIHWVAIIWKLRFTLESQANYYSCVILAYIIQFSQRFCAKYFLRNLKIFICSHFIAQNVQEGLILKVPNNWLFSGIQCAMPACSEVSLPAEHAHWYNSPQNRAKLITAKRLKLSFCNFLCGFIRVWTNILQNMSYFCPLPVVWEPLPPRYLRQGTCFITYDVI